MCFSWFVFSFVSWSLRVTLYIVAAKIGKKKHSVTKKWKKKGFFSILFPLVRKNETPLRRIVLFFHKVLGRYLVLRAKGEEIDSGGQGMHVDAELAAACRLAEQ